MIALAEEPKEFSAFTALAINIDKRQYARYVEKQHGPSTTRSASTTTLSSHRTSPPIPRPAPLSTQAQSPAPSQPPSMAMDLSQARHLSPEEKKRRQEQNLCYYCGHPDHTSKTCPNKVPKAGLANASVGDYSDNDYVTFDLGKANA